MIVSALLAASLAAAPPPSRMTMHRVGPASCPAEGRLTVRSREPALLLRPQDQRGDRGAQSLEGMPPANQVLTVARSVGGCAVSTVVRENVEGDGRFAK
ncbi:MAG: hypothetical protein Q8Q88_24445 [Phenylobacterium sp.]|uniref:hypothetical protein n=1 Tax=Phenylobacterium sp. TaxID=1871053 RepID=UPI002734F7DC|nr:hypothetical protein [Phenylobacterium sp.]MDP3750189.1 hypothetical protein [Phenylobacterium sp.]